MGSRDSPLLRIKGNEIKAKARKLPEWFSLPSLRISKGDLPRFLAFRQLRNFNFTPPLPENQKLTLPSFPPFPPLPSGNFSHISRCLRDHLKQCATSSPPTRPLLAQYHLIGSLEDSELHAIGLRPEAEAAVRRGTFWYLDERVFGKEVGAEDPFVRARREAGLKPLPRRKTPPLVEYKPVEQEEDEIMVQVEEVSVLPSAVGAQEEEEDEGMGMGRGKRKRRASAALAATTELFPFLSPLGGIAPLAIPFASTTTTSHHRRSTASTSAPAKYSNFSSLNSGSSGVPRLRLRLSNVVEVESSMDDEDGGQNSDANRRRQNKKKARRAASEGGGGARRRGVGGMEMERAASANSLASASVASGSGSGSGSASGSGDDDEMDEDRHHRTRRSTTSNAEAFSSALCSQLLSKTLSNLGSTSHSPIAPTTHRPTTATPSSSSSTSTLPRGAHSAITPAQLLVTRPTSSSSGPSHSHRQQHRSARGVVHTTKSRITLSVSAPHLFSSSHHSFSSMDIDEDESSNNSGYSSMHHRSNKSHLVDSGDEEEGAGQEQEDDFHEAMLRGEDFDFEWANESYGGPETAPSTSSSSTSTVATAVPVPSTSTSTEILLPLSQSNLASSTSCNPKMHKSLDTLSNASSSDHLRQQQPESRESSPVPIGLEGLDFNDAEEGEEGALDNVSTPATTPREESGETNAEGIVSALGMEATLCEALGNGLVKDEEDDVDVKVLVAGESEEIGEFFLGNFGLGAFADVGFADRVDSTESLTSLVAEEIIDTEPPLSAVRLVADPTILSMPLPSPLALELPTTLPLHTTSFSPDYDFVGHEDDDRSNYRNTYDHYIAEADDEEEDEEEDDMVTVKIEDDSGSLVNSARSSRQSSVLPMIDSFSRRLLAENSSSSSDGASSDSDAFDIVSSSLLLASGLPIAQPAPSPPSESADWSMHLDLDDLDIDLGNDEGDLLGPESVGLEELDLAWGGPSEQGPDETLAEWRSRSSKERSGTLNSSSSSSSLVGEANRRVMNGHGTFLTGSPVDGPTPLVSPRLGAGEGAAQLSRLTSLPLPTMAAPPLARLSSSTLTPTPTSSNLSSSSPRPHSNTIHTVYPRIPLDPIVTATIVQLAVAVYSVDLAYLATSQTCPLLRRIDTDYINGTVLLQATPTNLLERESLLAKIPKTFRVSPSETRGIEGVWIPRTAALEIVAQFSTELNHLTDFLDEDLGLRFAEPIYSLRCKLREDFKRSQKSPVGFPVFQGTIIEKMEVVEKEEAEGKEETGEEEEKCEVKVVVAAPKRRGRRKISVSSSPEVTEPTRRTRRSLASSG